MTLQNDNQLPAVKIVARIKKIFLRAISWIVISLLAIFVYLTFFVYRERFYCDRCGAISTVDFYQIPETEITLLTHRRITETSFSHAMRAHGFIGPHLHHWIFAHGKGNRVACTLAARGRYAAYTRLTKPHLDLFLDMLATYRGQPVTRRWCNRMLNADPKNVSLFVPDISCWLSRDDFNNLITDETQARAFILGE